MSETCYKFTKKRFNHLVNHLAKTFEQGKWLLA